MGSKKNKNKSKKTSKEEKSESSTPTVDYGATADDYADDDNEDDIHEQDEEEEEESDSEEEEDEKNSGSDDDGSDDDYDDDDEVEIPQINIAEGEEPCSFDLRNMTAVNSHPLHEGSLYTTNKNKKNKTEEEDKLTIGGTSATINEDYLLKKATEGCTQLIATLWQLPTERSDAGPMVTLPSYDVIPIPRALPPPAPKAETKWEKFAKERGIPLNKEKRSRKVWDETTNSWKFRHGYDKANSDSTSNYTPIMEVGANDDPYEDPWERQRDLKFERTEANRQNQMKNQERAGLLPKGTTKRVIKSRETSRQIGKEGGKIDRNNVSTPTGVPIDMNNQSLRGKSSTLAALKATQVSTASLGKFDKMREGEPERKLNMLSSSTNKKKRKMMAEGNTGAGGGEQERTTKVLQSVLTGGGVQKEKARKKGKLAKGVTAYDYEYDDGHDKTMYHNKKGRGGMGKNKKMTKRRIK